jgi:hypothetical protein
MHWPPDKQAVAATSKTWCSKPSWQRSGRICIPSLKNRKPATRNCNRPTKRSSAVTRNCRVSTRSWKRARRKSSRPMKSCKPLTRNCRYATTSSGVIRILGGDPFDYQRGYACTGQRVEDQKCESSVLQNFQEPTPQQTEESMIYELGHGQLDFAGLP